MWELFIYYKNNLKAPTHRFTYSDLNYLYKDVHIISTDNMIYREAVLIGIKHSLSKEYKFYDFNLALKQIKLWMVFS